MTDLFTLEPDEYGGSCTLVCRMRGCGEPLAVIHEAYVPLGSGDQYDPPEFGPDVALTTHWRVQCHAGHVHAVSQGEETAEPFYFDAFLAGGEMPDMQRHGYREYRDHELAEPECVECSQPRGHTNHQGCPDEPRRPTNG